jgi:hypothetical protein
LVSKDSKKSDEISTVLCSQYLERCVDTSADCSSSHTQMLAVTWYKSRRFTETLVNQAALGSN